jgi:hypothetical protein
MNKNELDNNPQISTELLILLAENNAPIRQGIGTDDDIPVEILVSLTSSEDKDQNQED